LEGYCVKCKQKQEMIDTESVFTKTGTPATKGVCVVCGTKMFRMGKTKAHEGLTPPKVEKKKPKRKGNLVIVESPAKARTVGRFLGKGYTVKASVGHVMDLLKSQLSVDVDNNFKPKYRIPNDKRPVVKELKKLSKKAQKVYLATDPDREGEAIAWHLVNAAEIDPEVVRRVVFHEITKPAIEEAFENTREIDMNLVNAQQARRVLDRLVGYNLSPLLWRKIRGRLSAGRVQSVALRLIVEREREIEAFEPEEYWTLLAEFKPDNIEETYITKLVRLDGKEPELKNQELVNPIMMDIEKSNFKISKIKKGVRRRKSSPPFTTSTLQQDASRRLSFTAKKTMAIAQQLYEGIDIGNGGAVGLITYMRTDSTNVSKIAQNEVREYVKSEFGEKFLPEKPPIYKTKVRGAQEAHEAIRPTSIQRIPRNIKQYLSRDQFRLYKLIWQRFIASQMSDAIYDTITVEVTGKSKEHSYLFRISGSNLRFQGFLKVYGEKREENQKNGNGEVQIPDGLLEDQTQELINLLPEQHFTQPPPRFTEASLVRLLEENGIGRPSTYAPILGTLQQRGYVTRESKRLFPTETGFLVNDLLTEYFSDVINVGFTAEMEEKLDKVAEGNMQWVKVVRDFYEPFEEEVKIADEKIPKLEIEPEKIGRACPKCGHELVIRWGRYGKFISCSNFPECRYTEPYLEKIGVKCPKDGGDLVVRKTRKGRTFYACSNYPECDFTSWKEPVSIPCPQCGGLLVKSDKKHYECVDCREKFIIDNLIESIEKMNQETPSA